MKHIYKIAQSEQIYYKPIFILMNQKGCLHVLLMEVKLIISNKKYFSIFRWFVLLPLNQCWTRNWIFHLVAICQDGRIFFFRPFSTMIVNLIKIFKLNLFNLAANISNQNWKSMFKNIILAPQFFRDEHIKRYFFKLIQYKFENLIF